jgi:hypothetical protein
MKLFFKIDLDNDLELILAAGRYSEFWQRKEKAILESFYKHTGLTFKQRRITVWIREDGRSKAGNTHRPMELSKNCIDEESIGCTLIHELAHRLAIGNGIDSEEGNPFIESRANYYVHRHIYLFLYDVFVDILGQEAALKEVARESAYPNSFYTKAWQWCTSKNYQQRQLAFARLKKRYIR